MEDKDFEIAMDLHTKKCDYDPNEIFTFTIRKNENPKRLIKEYKPTYPKDVTCFLKK